MPNFFLYGANPSELAGQQFGYDKFYTSTAEANRAAAARAAEVSMQAQAEADKAAAADEQQAAQNRINLWRYQMQDAAQRREDALRASGQGEQTRQFNVGQDANKAALAQDFALRSRQLDIQAQKPSAVDEQKLQYDYERAYKIATGAGFKSPTEIGAMFTSLKPEHIAQIWSQNKQARPEVAYNWQQYQSSADTLNEASRMKDYGALSTNAMTDVKPEKPSFGGGWWNVIPPVAAVNAELWALSGAKSKSDFKAKKAYEAQRSKDYAAKFAALATPATEIQHDKNLMGNLRFDPATGRWGPPPRPAFLTQGTGSTSARVKVRGPQGQTGTIEQGDTLPPGWTTLE